MVACSISTVYNWFSAWLWSHFLCFNLCIAHSYCLFSCHIVLPVVFWSHIRICSYFHQILKLEFFEFRLPVPFKYHQVTFKHLHSTHTRLSSASCVRCQGHSSLISSQCSCSNKHYQFAIHYHIQRLKLCKACPLGSVKPHRAGEVQNQYAACCV